ncbi:MAG: aminoacyl-tRNA hydrolase [Gammaproteobacteria bacterium HGW-Gammaproteobacteria-8]|nr:MAG: aminoacyl-tRNA hydrolase [Gammaproteobacteria bacterium HGW-Gammaproteobacteria-8]
MNGIDEDRRSRFLPPERELEEKFVLAGGPGGQHVNRTESAVQLRFDAGSSQFLDEAVRARLLQLAGKRADADGVIMIEARSHRSQLRNRAEARQRLAEMIERAHKKPRRRIATRPTRAAKKKRLKVKRQRARIKQQRGTPGLED